MNSLKYLLIVTLVVTSVITQEVDNGGTPTTYDAMNLGNQYNVERETTFAEGSATFTEELNFKFGESDKRAWKYEHDEATNEVAGIGDCPIVPAPDPVHPVIEVCDKWFKFGYDIAQSHTAIDMVKTYEGGRFQDSLGISGSNWAGKNQWSVFNNLCQNLEFSNMNGLDDTCDLTYGVDYTLNPDVCGLSGVLTTHCSDPKRPWCKKETVTEGKCVIHKPDALNDQHISYGYFALSPACFHSETLTIANGSRAWKLCAATRCGRFDKLSEATDVTVATNSYNECKEQLHSNECHAP